MDDFDLSSDVFAIRSSDYLNAPLAGTTIATGTVGTADINIFVDDDSTIQDVALSDVHFAYGLTSNQLLFDADGDWTSGTETIAVAPNSGGIGNSNFVFI